MPLDAADKARLAHEVLRLKENGIYTLDGVIPLVTAVDLSYVAEKGGPQQVGGTGHRLEGIAVKVAQATDGDLPGPTDNDRFIEYLFDLPLRSIYNEWKENSKLNLQQNHPDDYAEVRESWKQDEERRREADALMSARGEWPSREGGRYHGSPDWFMANAMFDLGREAYLAGDAAWDTDNIKAILVDSADYTVNLASHQFLSSVTGAGIVATSGNLTSKTVTAGVADAADFTWTAVAGDQSEAIIIYQDTGSSATSRLLVYIDTATGLPVTPNSGDIAVSWDNGANKIFKL